MREVGKVGKIGKVEEIGNVGEPSTSSGQESEEKDKKETMVEDVFGGHEGPPVQYEGVRMCVQLWWRMHLADTQVRPYNVRGYVSSCEPVRAVYGIHAWCSPSC